MSVVSTVTSRFAPTAATDIPAAREANSGTPLSAQQASEPDYVVHFSAKAMDLLQRRQVSEETTKQFAEIVQQAQQESANRDPKAFLLQLSSQQMETLRQVHSLAAPINIQGLSKEGAANLLVPPGSARDLDNNGLTTIGAAQTLTFPPENAPASFKKAWAEATEGMSKLEIPTQMIFAVVGANIHRDPLTGQVTSYEPDDPEWRNPYADPGYDYKGAVATIMESLTYEYERGMISSERYQHEMSFYSKLTDAMKAG